MSVTGSASISTEATTSSAAAHGRRRRRPREIGCRRKLGDENGVSKAKEEDDGGGAGACMSMIGPCVHNRKSRTSSALRRRS